MHERLDVVRAVGAALRLDRAQGGPVPLELASPRRGGPDPRRDPKGHAVQPARQRVAPPDRSGRPGQDEERGLESVLGLVMIAQDRLTDPTDHGPVPFHQRRERQLVSPGCEHLQQVPVADSRDRPGLEEEAEVALHRGVIRFAHGFRSGHPDFPGVVRVRKPFVRIFSTRLAVSPARRAATVSATRTIPPGHRARTAGIRATLFDPEHYLLCRRACSG